MLEALFLIGSLKAIWVTSGHYTLFSDFKGQVSKERRLDVEQHDSRVR